MGKIIETKIDRFDGGIENDSRDPKENTCRVVSNFDVFTNPRKMTPYRSSESGDSSAATRIRRNFCVAIRTGTTYSLYALGRQSAVNRLEVEYKDLTTGAVNDLDDTAWSATANNQSSSGTPEYNLFVYYQRTGYIYASTTAQIVRYDPDGGDAWVDTHQALTHTQIAQGLVHSKDDILYIPYYNSGGYIARNNNGTWNTTALTLPVHYIPSSICEYGNYLAIACIPTSGVGNSRVFLWDRDSSLTTISESIDWGEGMLMVLEEVDGELIGISNKGGAATSFTGIPNGTVVTRDKVIFRQLVGNRAIKFKEIQSNHAAGGATLQLPIAKQKVDNRLHFMMMIELNGAVRDGVWSIGRTPGGPWTLNHERTVNNNTALDTGDAIRNFIYVGDYLFQAYVDTDAALSKTDDGSTFSHNSVYESKRFNGGDSSLFKDLLGTTITMEYMPAAGDVTLQYRTDSTTTWTTISNDTTDNDISDSAVNIESSGAALPKEYKEIEFRILSTGGAEITGFSFKEEITGKRVYE